ncbi:YraN family protein [Verrucomicrobiota bacterium sgz303538]
MRSIGGVFSRYARHCFRWAERPSDPRHRLGWEGERAAARFLRRNGYKILYRNFRAPGGGEVDIVCRDKNTATLVFVEVKTRTSTDFGSPGSAVDTAKQRLIARGATAWLRMLDREDIPFRFDIVEVVPDANGKLQCSLIQYAFSLPAPLRW